MSDWSLVTTNKVDLKNDMVCMDIRQIPLPEKFTHWEADWEENWSNLVDLTVQNLSQSRFKHVARVAILASQLAFSANLDTRRVYAAGILHDLAREKSDTELLELVPSECEEDLKNPLVLHGRAARKLLEQISFTDQKVLTAIEYHVTAPCPYELEAICVYIADISEPAREVNQDIREEAFFDLNSAFKKSILSKVKYLESKNIKVHPRTFKIWKLLAQD